MNRNFRRAMNTSRLLLSLSLLATLLAGAAPALAEPDSASAHAGPRVLNEWFAQGNHHYVSFAPQTPATPVPNLPTAVGGRLLLPKVLPAPAVLILHGSSGVDSRTARYADRLREAGFVTLEADIWQAMGVSASNRPRTVHETMPSVWGALRYLSGRPEVRADRIGVLGFSWGGVQTMLAARTAPQPGEPRFAAFRAMYPLCWAYNRVPGYELNQVHGPLQIGIGEKDDYDEGSAACQALALRLDSSGQQVQVQAYANAFHGFERLEPEVVVNDPYSHFGRGGTVTLKPNPGQGARAIGDALNFFERRLGRP